MIRLLRASRLAPLFYLSTCIHLPAAAAEQPPAPLSRLPVRSIEDPCPNLPATAAAVRSLPAPARTATAACLAARLAAKIRPTLPLRIDDMTSQTAVESRSQVLTLTITTARPAATFPLDETGRFPIEMRAKICGSGFASMVAYGVTPTVRLVDRDGKLVAMALILDC